MEELEKPEWWPKNLYKTNKRWELKSINEQIWEQADEYILKSYLEHNKSTTGIE